MKTNSEIIEAMEKLHNEGFKTFASIEPVIDFRSSWEMIALTHEFCDLYKIGLMSGKSYDKLDLNVFIEIINRFIANNIYFKDYLLKASGINRDELPANCVNRDYNIFKTNL